MKRLVLAFLLISVTAPLLHAQTVTPEDREMAVKYLQKTLDGVMAATKGLSEAQWNFKADTNRWSVSECAEHIAAAEDFLMNMVEEKVMKAPPRTEPTDVKALDEMVLKMIPDRSRKAQAPEPLRPANRFGTPQESLKHFKESRAKTIAFLKKTDDLRQHAVDSPLGKQLDGFEWVLFVAAHSERHTKQMLEVKADPNFPKK
jgi:hypothetical protein